MQEKCIDDCWKVNENRGLRDSWTGFTKFILLCEKPVRALYSARGPHSNPPRGEALAVCLIPVSSGEVDCGGGGAEQKQEKSGTSIRER